MNKTILNFNKVIFLILLSTFISYAQDSIFPQISGWNVNIEKEVYDPNTLWDYINGAADLYLEYDFIDLNIAYYIKDSTEIRAEVYHHSSPINAFGIYSQERDPEYNFSKIGAQGYILPEGVLNFWSGNYYIKLYTRRGENQAHDELYTVAKKIEDQLKQNNKMPEIFNFFPEKGKQPNTEQFIAQNFLGYNFLKSAATVMYSDGDEFKIFIINAESPQNAKLIMDSYLAIVPDENIKKIGNYNYDINDPRNGKISIAVQNNYIFGIINCTDELVNSKLMLELNKNLL